MLRNLLRKIKNRRKEHTRVDLKLPVKTADLDGRAFELESENISDSGIRVRSAVPNLAEFVGHREQVPLDIHLGETGEVARIQARLVWAYHTSEGGTVSGWQFGQFEGDAERMLLDCLNRHKDN